MPNYTVTLTIKNVIARDEQEAFDIAKNNRAKIYSALVDAVEEE